MRKKAIVALSGGVDSAVSAALLLEQGWDVAGLTMEVIRPRSVASGDDGWEARKRGKLSQATQDARKVAEFLNIPFYYVNLEKEFRERVIQLFYLDYTSGRTPNPCVICNRFIKFGLLQEEAFRLGADTFATGHYARVSHHEGRYLLSKGLDRKKDQSYFLFYLQQEQLAATVFPLGTFTKERVREKAKALGIPSMDRSESQDICFLPDQDYVRFLENDLHVQRSVGDVVHVSGQRLGRHEGIYRYTIGQRKGLGISWPRPLYVVRIDADNNRVIVGEKEHLAVSSLRVESVNWVIPSPEGDFRCKCRIRYRHRESPAVVFPLEDGSAEVLFDEPQKGVTPGQAAVFYDDDVVIGGGWIR